MKANTDHVISITQLLQNISVGIGYSVREATDVEKKRMSEQRFRALDAANVVTDVHKLFSESTYGDKTLLIAITTLNYLWVSNASNVINFFYAVEENELSLNLYVSTNDGILVVMLDKHYEVPTLLKSVG